MTGDDGGGGGGRGKKGIRVTRENRRFSIYSSGYCCSLLYRRGLYVCCLFGCCLLR
jgi:hypothetical protein